MREAETNTRVRAKRNGGRFWTLRGSIVLFSGAYLAAALLGAIAR